MRTKNIGIEKLTLRLPLIGIELKFGDEKVIPVHIFCLHSGKCLDVQDWSTADGGHIIQYSLHGGNNQKWLFEPAGNGFYHIVSVHSGKVLDVEGASLHDAGNVIQYQKHRGDNQKWYLKAVGNGYCHIINKHSGKCLDVKDASRENAAQVFQYTIHGGENQRWTLLIAEPFRYE